MRWIRCIFFGMLYGLVVCFINASGQSFNFSKLNTYNGLSHNQINAIIRDADGFVWFGTLAGLNRYDGYTCKIFRKRPGNPHSLPDNNIRQLFELPHGKMWVVTMAGACIYSAETESFESDVFSYLKKMQLPEAPVRTLIKGSSSKYWILYEDNQLYMMAAGNNKSAPVSLRFETGSDLKIANVCQINEQQIWILYQNGLLQLMDIGQMKVLSTCTLLQKAGLSPQNFNLVSDADGHLWVWGTNTGVYYINPAANSFQHFNDRSVKGGLYSNLVSAVLPGNDGIIWVATDHGGITLINKADNFSTRYILHDPKDPRSLSQNSITAVFKDSDGIIWIGTYKQGVNYLNSRLPLFALYRHQEANANSLPYDDVNCFVEAKDGNLWIGTNGGGLLYFDRNRNTFKQYLHNPANPRSLSSNVIVSLCIDHQGVLWVGTYFGGLNKFDGSGFDHFLQKEGSTTELAGNNIWEIYEDSQRNLLIGTLGYGLFYFNRQTNSYEPVAITQNMPHSFNYISSMLQNKGNELWIGSSGGIAVLQPDKSIRYFTADKARTNGLLNNNIICMLKDRSGQIWVGTREGLHLYDEATVTFKGFTTADGLPDNLILTILQDHEDNLWVSTPNGLCKIIVEVQKGKKQLNVITYSEANNLQSREFNENAALVCRSGELVFGGPAGFNIIDPAKTASKGHNQAVLLTGLQILNTQVEPEAVVNGRVLLPKALNLLQDITLRFDENVFTIEFASLNFANNAAEKYAYMLEGFNPQWLYADGNQRRATYTNLSPGRYTFRVKMQNDAGQWSPERILQIQISPPFWRSKLAYLLYAIIMAGLFLLARRIVLDRIHMRYEVQLQRREAERAQAMEQMKTKFFTNVSHEFRTPLSLILAPLEKLMTAENPGSAQYRTQLHLIQRNARRLLSLVNQLLDFRRMEVQEMKVHLAAGDIVEFSRDIVLSFTDIAEKKNIELSFGANVERRELYFDRDKIEKILFNLVSNAFKYTPDNGKVSVSLEYLEAVENRMQALLVIEVKDTGIGIEKEKQELIFERFFQTDVPESMANQGSGIGLAITKEFVRLHQGTITVNSQPGQGSTFRVEIPAQTLKDAHLPEQDSYAPDADMASGAVNAPPGQEPAPLPAKSHTREGAKEFSVLVVEDNDDLRFYLKDNLQAKYHVIEAANGADGWEKAVAEGPNFIITDYMMPYMTGFELVRKLKTDPATAHIPVILLSAVANPQKQLEGMRLGANDYITKPFTFEILDAKIANLLAQQKLLQQKFQRQVEVNPAEIAITPVDEQFLKDALEVVEKQMDNPDFSVEQLSAALFMNRTTLYRKITAITGLTPLEFIRNIRLKRAAQLLQKSGRTIAEVAYEVGYNNPKLFAKLFKEQFNVTPSQYQQQAGKTS